MVVRSVKFRTGFGAEHRTIDLSAMEVHDRPALSAPDYFERRLHLIVALFGEVLIAAATTGWTDGGSPGWPALLLPLRHVGVFELERETRLRALGRKSRS